MPLIKSFLTRPQQSIYRHAYIHRFTCPFSNRRFFIYRVIDQPRNRLTQFRESQQAQVNLAGLAAIT
jgi:hypothetical protein